MPNKSEPVKIVDFNWARSSDIYQLNGHKVIYKTGGAEQYHPVVGDLPMLPNTGRYFFEYRVNCDNTRVGLCTEEVNLCGEMGKTPENVSLNLQTGSVEVNGIEVKQMWRIVTPISGALLGFMYDSATGIMQLYFETEYAGIAFGPECCLQGKTVYPCVGLAGVELNNRNIGVGKKSAVVTVQPELYINFLK